MTKWTKLSDLTPDDGFECFIWLKPINSLGDEMWSIRKGRFWKGQFTEWPEVMPYKPEVQARITHWAPMLAWPPANEIEGGKP